VFLKEWDSHTLRFKEGGPPRAREARRVKLIGKKGQIPTRKKRGEKKTRSL